MVLLPQTVGGYHTGSAAYCVLQGIDYQVEECPNAVGNKHLGYKEALNAIEEQSPGSKNAFYFGFLARAADKFAGASEKSREDLRECPSCGSPTGLLCEDPRCRR